MWKAGAQVHVSWSLTANHGGGYQVSHVSCVLLQKVPRVYL